MYLQENATIGQLLDKWSHLIPQNAFQREEKKLELWTDLCPKVMPIVISAMLKLHQVCSRTLEDQILDPKNICTSYELFNQLNPCDMDVQSIMSELTNFTVS